VRLLKLDNKGETMNSIKLIQGDCLEKMKDIKYNSVDLILCDLPYGTTACKWDTIIPFKSLWEQYNRIIKYNGAIVLFCNEPFTSSLINSNIELFKYKWIWEKSQGVNFAQCNHMPMSNYEEISVFGNFGMSKNAKVQPIYNPQGIIEINKQKSAKTSTEHRVCDNNKEHIQKYENYPNQIIKFKSERGFHPTQKPVPLLEYLIKTYTNENELVLDNTFGSCSTGIACINTNRNFIGIEKDEKYFNIGVGRVKENITENYTLEVVTDEIR
jgi:site-specific DNA-methyltransferase (adenine-specific)